MPARIDRRADEMTDPSGSENKLNSIPAVVVLCADKDVRDVVSRCCIWAGVQAFTTFDGYEANIVLKNYPIRLLIVDRFLPPWPGLDTLPQLRSANSRLRIAFVDDGGRDAAVLARVSGAHLVLSKPISHGEMLSALSD
jgi:DNA-binding response OmpR family regulator